VYVCISAYLFRAVIVMTMTNQHTGWPKKLAHLFCTP